MNKYDQSFLQLVHIFHTSAMTAMGKLKNPATDKIERNLDQAREYIDIIEMLREKTKGNLNSDQQQLMEGILTDLRLNFVDEKNKDQVTP
ncbi:MAG: DUF1844 domain-containing protein [Bacteroidia bacterium]|nr:DUF1844 domain-containing protein [Bacteroidia bacterium]